jgi:hypothetical protein
MPTETLVSGVPVGVFSIIFITIGGSGVILIISVMKR